MPYENQELSDSENLSPWARGSCETRHTTVTLFAFCLEEDLNPELLLVLIVPIPVAVLTAINLAGL